MSLEVYVTARRNVSRRRGECRMPSEDARQQVPIRADHVLQPIREKVEERFEIGFDRHERVLELEAREGDDRQCALS